MKCYLVIVFLLKCSIAYCDSNLSINGTSHHISFGRVTSQFKNNSKSRLKDNPKKLSISSNNCVIWINGQPPSDQDIINSAENLCRQGLIPNVIDVSLLNDLRISDASLYTLNALYRGNIPNTLPSDNFPTFFGDLDVLSTSEVQAVKAMCFLEYGDGRSCLTRDFMQLNPHHGISIGYTLRMLYEAWNVPPDTAGYNVFNPGPSTFLSNISHNDFDYGYFQKAYTDGFLSKYISNGQLLEQGVSSGQFYLFLLNEINSKYGNNKPVVMASSFHTPNNIQLNNASTSTDITRAVFKTYEQDSFALPSGGLGLHFSYSYHSDWLDLPTLGYSYTNVENAVNSNFIDERAKEHNFALGLGWTHSYNIFAQSLFDDNDKDRYILIRWGDGTIEVYNTVTSKFESAGVYDKLTIVSASNGHITAFNIMGKDQVTTTFTSPSGASALNNPIFFQATQIKDENGNTVVLNYENANCINDASNCAETSNIRLSTVTDSYSNRSLTFHYAPNSDLLSSVTDVSGARSIQFHVNQYTLNLDAVTNAKNNTTKYNYGLTDTANHLLITIQRPLGNTVTNIYYDRKLHATQTADYTTTVSFSPSYGATYIGTQSMVNVQPLNSPSNFSSVTYNQNAAGMVTSITSASVNTVFSYNDSGNPTLPTSIVDNNTSLQQHFQYDSHGNTLESDYSRNGLTQINRYTYDATNHVLSHTWPNNTLTTYAYDGKGNNTGQYTSPFKIEYGYYGNGTLSTQTDAVGVIADFSYNLYGNLSLISYNNSTVKYSAKYDADSRLQYITDGNGVQTNYTFDPDDNISSVVVDPTKLNITTKYAYDTNDNVVTVTPPNGGAPTNLTYDGNDNVIKEYQFLFGPSRYWIYNDDGTLRKYTDKNNNQFNYTYFPLKDPNEGKLSSTGFQNYVYDNTTRLLHAVSTNNAINGTIYYGYDQLLRTNDVYFNSPKFTSEVSYSYDISGNITNINLTSIGKSFTYVYDPLNRLQTIKDWNNKTLVTYIYQNNGLLDHEVLSNGVMVRYHYDNANRLDSIYSVKSDLKTSLHAIGATLDNNGNHIHESYFVNWNGKAGSKFYQQQGTISFANDQSYNWLTQINKQTVSNDLSGNILTNPFEQFSNGGYDVHNHLTSASINGKQKNFSYDALDARYANDTLNYIIDHINNNNVLGIEKNTANAPSVLYVYSPYGLVCSINPQTADPTFYLYDFRGSTVATVDKTQTVTDYFKYDPWGNVTEGSSTPGVSTPFLFVGKYGVMYDSPNLYYMRARYYDPVAGRFYGEDSKWSTNLYSYAGNNPISNIDPTGQCPLCLVALGVTEAIPYIDFALQTLGTAAMGYYSYKGDFTKASQYYIPGIDVASIEGPEFSSTVGSNKLAGDFYRDDLASYLKQQGKKVTTEVYKSTPFGPRWIDIQVSDDYGNVLGGIETKTGNSPYKPSQRAKDYWLKNYANYPVILVRKPK